MKRSKAGTKKRSPDGLSLLNQYTIMVAFYKIWKKHNEIQNNIKQNGLEQSEHEKPQSILTTTVNDGRTSGRVLKPIHNEIHVSTVIKRDIHEIMAMKTVTEIAFSTLMPYNGVQHTNAV